MEKSNTENMFANRNEIVVISGAMRLYHLPQFEQTKGLHYFLIQVEKFVLPL